jgi:hypothetical protein
MKTPVLAAALFALLAAALLLKLVAYFQLFFGESAK